MILETPRLTLRKLTHDDLPFMAELLGDARVMRFWPAPLTRDQAAAWIDNHLQRYLRDGYGYWLAIERDTGRPVGQAGLLACEVDGVVEPSVGYMLMPFAWGTGLALEATRGCLRWGFVERAMPRITCLVQPENVPSLRVAIRAGFIPEKHVRYKGIPHLCFSLRADSADCPPGDDRRFPR